MRTDRHAMWLEWMNSKIGKPAPLVSDFYQKSLGTPFEYEITQYKGRQVYKSKSSLVGACSARTIISVDTHEIVGWDYLPGSDPEKCIAPPKNCAW